MPTSEGHKKEIEELEEKIKDEIKHLTGGIENMVNDCLLLSLMMAAKMLEDLTGVKIDLKVVKKDEQGR